MTIQELYNENDGREGVRKIIEMINSKYDIWGILSSTEKEVLQTIGHCGVDHMQNEDINETWLHHSRVIKSPNFADIFRVRLDYELPAEEPAKGEVFWGDLLDFDYCPTYSHPMKRDKWDDLALWANVNGWEFNGFFLSKTEKIISDANQSDRLTPWYFPSDDDCKMLIKPFAKFTKKV